MFFPTVAVVCALSLFPSTHALALVDRQSDCGFVCPEVDADGNGFSIFAEVSDTSFSCTYSGAFETPCIYDTSSGALSGDNSDGSCPQNATPQCPALRRRDYDGQKSSDGKPSWSGSPTPTSSWSKPTQSWSEPTQSWSKPTQSWSKPTQSWSKPTQSWSQPPHTWSKPSPSPSPSWSPKPQPPKNEPCKYTCPQKDLIKSSLTDEAIRDPYLFCRYPTKTCEQCGFCKYSTKTGVLVEDNDDGNCPKTAPLALPWDRRNN